MHDLVAQGKVLYWGTSEWSADQIAEAHGVARALGLTPPTMEQPQYNLFVRDRVEREYARLYETFGLGTTIWSPLASGVLAGKYAAGVPAGARLALPGYEWLRQRLESAEGRAQVRMAGDLAGVARDLGATLPQLSIAWCLANPRVSTVILGASQPAQLRENLAALELAPKLTPEVLARVEAIVGNKPAPPERY
jgi:aryl-alcohol dehydrogenase-like predicted oxidoreductase